MVHSKARYYDNENIESERKIVQGEINLFKAKPTKIIP